MKTLVIISLVIMFISLYMLSLFLIIYFRHRKTLWEIPKLTKKYPVSILVPAYNEEGAIEDTIRSIFNLDYSNILEVIAINDGSKDKTLSILKKLEQEFPKLIILNKQNSGKADSLNQALKIAKGDLITVIDSDSFPRKDALTKSIGFFDDKEVGIVTIPILARNKKTFFEKLQAIDWTVVAFTRKLLEKVECIFVTPGPLAIYRREAILSTGGFDKNNMTEDIEMTWHILSNGWKIRMSMGTEVTTLDPTKFKQWYRQRQRWTMGGTQSVLKYRKLFFRKGMLGFFILPLFGFSTLLALFGFGLFSFLIIKNIVRGYFLLRFSIDLGSTMIPQIFNLLPGAILYFGLLLLFMGVIFTSIVLTMMKEELFRKRNFFLFFVYLMIYPILGPFIALTATFKLIKKDMSW